MQKGSELRAGQEQVSQQKHLEVAKLWQGQSTSTCLNTTQISYLASEEGEGDDVVS